MFVIVGNVLEDKFVVLIMCYLGLIKYFDLLLVVGKLLICVMDNVLVIVKE